VPLLKHGKDPDERFWRPCALYLGRTKHNLLESVNFKLLNLLHGFRSSTRCRRTQLALNNSKQWQKQRRFEAMNKSLRLVCQALLSNNNDKALKVWQFAPYLTFNSIFVVIAPRIVGQESISIFPSML